MQGPLSRVGTPVAMVRRSLCCLVPGLLVFASAGSAQGDSVSAGPPPHFAAAWAPPGTLIDVSRTPALRRRVSLDLTKVPIETALTRIVAQAELKLLYRPDILPAGRTASIRAQEITVASALAEVLLDTGLDVVMTRGGHFALVACTHLSALAAPDARDSGVVAGRVTDRTTNAPLAGALVTAEGTRLEATADGDGQYRLTGLPAGAHALRARHIGHTPATATVLVDASRTLQDFALEPSAQQLEQVVVTGPLVPTEVKALPTPITVITADDIRRQNVTRLAQLFRGQVAGALAWDRPADDHYNTINVRGATSLSTRSVKTLIDGIEVADPQFISLVDPNSIERIELARGPQASTMYGSDAIGGVLQIFTKKGEFSRARPGGEFKTSTSIIERNDGPGVGLRLEDAVALHGGEQHTRYHAAAYYRHDGEWTPSYHNTNWSVSASAENVQGLLTSRITALLARKLYDRAWSTTLRDAGYAAYSKPPFETIDLQTQTYGINFNVAAKSWWRHDLVLGYDRWAFGLVQTAKRLTTPKDTLLQVIMNQRGKMSMLYLTTISARLDQRVGATLTTGFNYYHLDGSDAFNPATTATSGTLDGPATILRLPSSNSGYFAQAQATVAERAFLTAGLRAERSPGFGQDVGTAVSPRFGTALVRSIGPIALKLRGSYGESIRAPEPSQNQQFLAAGFERLYNPALRPERQRGSDGGVDFYWGPRASLSVTYYSQDAVDLIDRVFIGVVGDPPRQQSKQENVGRIKNRGWEVEARYSSEQLQVAGSLSAMSSRIQQLDSAYGGDYRVGDRLFDVPRYTVGVTVAWTPVAGNILRGAITGVGSWVQRDLVAFLGAASENAEPRPLDRDYTITYPGFIKLRVGLEQRLWKGVTGTLDVDNLTGRRVFETDNITTPSPRILSLALRATY